MTSPKWTRKDAGTLCLNGYPIRITAGSGPHAIPFTAECNKPRRKYHYWTIEAATKDCLKWAREIDALKGEAE